MVPFEKYEALVQMVAQMKRDGFHIPEEWPQPAPAAELPGEVDRAIAELELDPITSDQLTRTAWNLLRGGMEAGEVALRIAAGEPAEL